MAHIRAEVSLTQDRQVSACRSQNVVRQFARDQLVAPPVSPPAPYQEPVVPVLVSGVRLLLPEHALSAGLSDLCLRTEGYVTLAGYAEGVALVLAALANAGLIGLRGLPVQPSDS